MDEFTLLVALAGLLMFLVLATLVFVIMKRPRAVLQAPAALATFEQLVEKIMDNTASNAALNTATTAILKRFVMIENYEPYEGVLKKLCVHPNSDSKMVSLFEKTLREANPKFKDKLGKSLKEGLGKRDKK